VPAEASLDQWEMLRRGGQVSTALEIPSVDTGVDTGSGSVRLALGNAGELRLLLPVRQSERIAESPSSQGLRIGAATYVLGGTPIRFLDITCLSSALDGVFADVAGEIMDRVAEGASPVHACRTTIEDFRSLLVASAMEVTVQEIRGLIGELLMLRTLLALDAGAWKLWRGPLRDRHDFRGGAFAIEVKTTSRSSVRKVTISAVDQLMAPADGNLQLAVFHVEEAAGGDLSIARLAADVATAASDRQELGRLLAAYGCPDPEAGGWNRCRFRLEGEAHYQVDERFPRIIPESFANGTIPTGVESLSYIVDLGAAEPCRLSDEVVVTRIAELIACLDSL
jgi:hypothetical protein